MKTISRHIRMHAKETASTFRAVCMVGPRQSGKTTLSHQLFGDKPYLNFEVPETEARVRMEGVDFLRHYKNGAILDEVQRVPDLFRYLQGELDVSRARGKFILTGSSNFLLQEQLSQSLAGRVGYLELLPLTFAELCDARMEAADIATHILKGGYPEIWQQNLDPSKWMSAYIKTYIQRDVRLIKNILNLNAFDRFLHLCAGYAGQLVNRDALGAAAGVDAKTVQSWLTVLESSYIIFLLQPYHNNLNKRIIKSPKLYFYDTGVLCNLLSITSVSGLRKHPLYGNIFENWVISEIKKNRLNSGLSDGMYFFRDSAGNEIDLIVEQDGAPKCIEVKSSAKYTPDMMKGLRYWLKNSRGNTTVLIYGGEKQASTTDNINVVGWKEVAHIN
ncbi:MAG: ATP-binding protein [Cyclobacteriaceae bacterium]|nr:ATP-binding protein [Cyclobacteriaceae bacterium]